jgi:hypothetical protein
VCLVTLVLLVTELQHNQNERLLALNLQDGGRDFQLDTLAALAVAAQLIAPATTLTLTDFTDGT